jgi:hypothetical protein
VIGDSANQLPEMQITGRAEGEWQAFSLLEANDLAKVGRSLQFQ